MALKVRRVVTGHDSTGKAIVLIDEVVGKLKEGRPGAMVAPIWTTEKFPVNNDGQDDAGTRPVGTTLPPRGPTMTVLHRGRSAWWFGC